MPFGGGDEKDVPFDWRERKCERGRGPGCGGNSPTARGFVAGLMRFRLIAERKTKLGSSLERAFRSVTLLLSDVQAVVVRKQPVLSALG